MYIKSCTLLRLINRNSSVILGAMRGAPKKIALLCTANFMLPHAAKLNLYCAYCAKYVRRLNIFESLAIPCDCNLPSNGPTWQEVALLQLPLKWHDTATGLLYWVRIIIIIMIGMSIISMASACSYTVVHVWPPAVKLLVTTSKTPPRDPWIS